VIILDQPTDLVGHRNSVSLSGTWPQHSNLY
jgi:hypothetical protein